MNKKVSIIFIINPIAGNRKDPDIVSVISKNLESNWDAEFLCTKYPGHASELVRENLSKGITYFIAVGGDGTVNEVASELVGQKAVLGIIPCGSGNGLSRSLGIPLSVGEAVGCINQNNLKKIDVGLVNNRYFFCTCGLGFDAQIGKKFAKQNTRGFLTYIKTTLREYRQYNPKKYKIIVDDKKIKRKAFLITVANAGQYGNNAYIAPQANMYDGYLDLCILKPFPVHKSVLLGVRLFLRKIDRSKYYETTKGMKIEIFKKKAPFHVDGEPLKMKGSLKIQVKHKALNVLAIK